MTKIVNNITIDAPLEKVWGILANIGELDRYDPTVARSTVTSTSKNGVGSSRKVDMKDGTHWFKEETTVCTPNEALAFELTDCNFPIDGLTHSYNFEHVGGKTKVTQIMEYKVKYGFLGKIMDALMLRKQTDSGVKKFFQGLKEYAESAS